MKSGISLMNDERIRQVLKGYDKEHDEMETAFQLSSAAALYICNAQNKYFMDHTHYDDRGEIVRFQGREVTDDEDEPLKWESVWPWGDHDGRKDADILTSLIKAGALIAAEIDRLTGYDRMKQIEAAETESPPPSLQEAAEAWKKENEKYMPDEQSEGMLYESFIAGWNARDSQQTGPILTREVFNKIWKAAEQKAIATQEHAQDFITWGEWDKIPDDDTIFNSLNH